MLGGGDGGDGGEGGGGGGQNLHVEQRQNWQTSYACHFAQFDSHCGVSLSPLIFGVHAGGPASAAADQPAHRSQPRHAQRLQSGEETPH